MDIFEKASRQKLRFPFRGQVTVEDLWDLSVQEIDTIFKGLNKELKGAAEESLIASATVTAAQKTLQLQVEILKSIFATKTAEAARRKSLSEKQEKRKVLLDLLAKKQAGALEAKTEEELLAEINGLDAEESDE